jgi:hypothetical protein
MVSRGARQRLPPPNRSIDISRLQLNQSPAPTCPFGGNQSRARAAKRVKNDCATIGAVADGVATSPTATTGLIYVR